MEKFAIKKAERFLIQGNNLALPVLEMVYMWNNFRILGQQYQLTEAVYVLVEKTMNKLNEAKGKYFKLITSVVIV